MWFWRAKPSSLRQRLLLVLVGSVVTVSSVAMVLDYRREHERRLDAIATSLVEQASALQASHSLVDDPNVFRQYVDEFCATMDERISPGHHIVVLDTDGSVLAASRRHSGPRVEQALLNTTANRSVTTVDDHRLLYVRSSGVEGHTFILAQYLDHAEAALRSQLLRRAFLMMLIVLIVTLLTYLAVAHWVVGPLEGLVDAAQRWARREFAARAPLSGPSDFRAVSQELNSMVWQLEMHEERQQQEFEEARQIQAGLLPKLTSKLDGLTLAAEYRPAAHVAGDLYDAFGLADDRIAIAVLDVSGHGLSAAMLTGVVKTSLRHHLTQCADLSEAVRCLNSDILACTSDSYFVTACVGIWDPKESRWTYCAAGHPGGILIREGKTVVLPSTAALLGVLPEGDWEARSVTLSPHDRIVLYTDGITEALVDGVPFDVGRLRMVLEHTCNLSLSEQTRAVMQAIDQTDAGRMSDDATVIAFEPYGRASAIV